MRLRLLTTVLLLISLLAQPIIESACSIHELSHGGAAEVLGELPDSVETDGAHAVFHRGTCCSHVFAALPFVVTVSPHHDLAAAIDSSADGNLSPAHARNPLRPPISQS